MPACTTRLALAAVLAAMSAATPAATPAEMPAAAPAAVPVEGLWERHEIDFLYAGRTSFYTCDSLARKLGELLEAAGARADFRARPRGCEAGFDRVARFPSVRLEFHVLVPGAAQPDAPPAAALPERRLGRDAPTLVPAHVPQPGVGAWRTVELGPQLPRWLALGDCELVEQFRRDVLPKFHTRMIEDRIRCVQHQRIGSDVRLKFEVLGPLPDADVPGRRAPR